jgi:hypothetical protein
VLKCREKRDGLWTEEEEEEEEEEKNADRSGRVSLSSF